MDPNDVSLSNIDKLFEYEKHSRIIDECEDINQLKMLLKYFIKLYLKQQEVVSELGSL